MRRFLTLKHWQLFILLIGIPLIFEFILLGTVFSTNDPFQSMRTIFIALPIIMTICMVLYFSWFYSLGTNLFDKLPEAAGMSLTRFKVFLIIPFVYIIFFCVFMFGLAPSLLAVGPPNPLIFLVIFPIHLFCMFCLFYCLYFNAKVLKTVELQRPVTFSDYAGEFFLLWFFPVGVWILQPRINRLFVATTE